MAFINGIESARLSGVLGEALDRLTLISSLPPKVSHEANRDAGGVLTTVIATLQAGCDEYNAVSAAREAAKSASLKARVAEASVQLREISVALRAHLRSLSRVVRESSDPRSELAALLAERTALVEVLERTMGELDDAGAYTVLSGECARDAALRATSAALIAREAEVTSLLSVETTAAEREASDVNEAQVRRRADVNEMASKLARQRATDAQTLRLVRKEKAALVESTKYTALLGASTAEEGAAALAEQLRVERNVGEAMVDEYKAQIVKLEALRDESKARLAVDVISNKAVLEAIVLERDMVHGELMNAQRRYEADLAKAAASASGVSGGGGGGGGGGPWM